MLYASQLITLHLEASGWFLVIIGYNFCVTSIYAAWHIGIASSSNFVVSLSSHFVFRTISQKWLVRLIQIWHVDVTGPEGVLYSFVTLNSH